MNKSRVYIAIVTYNSSEYILSCLRCLKSQTYKQLTITIFDNNSSDDTIPLVRKNFEEIRIIQSGQNLGFGKAHNQIIDSTAFNKDDYYLMLNPDALLRPSYIKELVELMNRKKSAYATGKLLFHTSPKKNIIYSVGHGILRNGYVFNIGHGMIDTGKYEIPREVFGAPAAASLWRFSALKVLLQNTYVFDPEMFMYNEDTDLDWRAKYYGLSCWYSPKAVAVHKGSKPDNTLSLHAVRNRYISVIKNAAYKDLFTYNLYVILFHCIFRTLFTPRDGFWLIRELLFSIPKAITERSHIPIDPEKIYTWFRWSKKELTCQPITTIQRYQDFEKRLRLT